MLFNSSDLERQVPLIRGIADSADIVCIANVEENRAKLAAMHAAVNSNDSRYYLLDTALSF